MRWTHMLPELQESSSAWDWSPPELLSVTSNAIHILVYNMRRLGTLRCSWRGHHATLMPWPVSRSRQMCRRCSAACHQKLEALSEASPSQIWTCQPPTREHMLSITTTYGGRSSCNTTDQRSSEILCSLNVVVVISVLPSWRRWKARF